MRQRWITGLVLVLLGWVAQTSPASEIQNQEWFCLFLGGTRAGHAQITRSVIDAGGEKLTRTETIQEMALGRMGHLLTVRSRSVVDEDALGNVRSFRTESSTGGQTMVSEGQVQGDQLILQTRGKKQQGPFPQGALGPAALEALTLQKGLTAGTRFQTQIFLPEYPFQPVDATVHVVGLEKKKWWDTSVELIRQDLEYSILPGMPVRAWTEPTGRVLIMEIQMPLVGSLEMVASTREVALQKVEPAEMFASTLIVPNQAIPRLEKLQSLKLRLATRDGSPLGVPEVPGQMILENHREAIVLQLNRVAKPAQPFTSPPTPRDEWKAFLSPSPFIDSDHPAVERLAVSIRDPSADAITLAGKIQEKVYRAIKKKNLGIGFATAGETAESLEGDCTEHAVLAAAIARALGYPSRVVSGIVYVDSGELGSSGEGKGIFGFHMWTEIMVAPDIWFPIDAALNRTDPSRIALDHSPLDQPSPDLEASIRILRLIGNLDITVL